MKRIKFFAAVLLVAGVWLAAPPGAAVSAEKTVNKPFPCHITGISFNAVYTLRAALNKACHLRGTWSWRVQTGDYQGYLGPLGPSAGRGIAFTLPVVKATAGRLAGFNPPGYMRAIFTFAVKWHGVRRHVTAARTWNRPTTHLIGIGQPPKVQNLGGTGPTTCQWDRSAQPSFDGLTAKQGSVVCSGAGTCTWQKMPSQEDRGQYYLYPTQVSCTTGEHYHVYIVVFYNLNKVDNSVQYECATNWSYVSSVTLSNIWGPANVDTQITLLTNGSQDLWETPSWVNLHGTVDPCTSDWKH